MCQLSVIARNNGRNRRASIPRPASSRLSASSFRLPPRRTSRKLHQTPRRTTRFAIAIANRNVADTAVPTKPPTCLAVSNRSCMAAAVAAIASDARMTMVEWPSENHSPTVCGRFPSCISLRTTLSMAAMWSASTAWRSPNTQASSAIPSSAGRSWNATQAQVQAMTLAAIRPPYSDADPRRPRSPPTMPLTRRGPQMQGIPAARRAHGATTDTRPRCPRRSQRTRTAPRCRD